MKKDHLKGEDSTTQVEKEAYIFFFCDAKVLSVSTLTIPIHSSLSKDLNRYGQILFLLKNPQENRKRNQAGEIRIASLSHRGFQKAHSNSAKVLRNRNSDIFESLNLKEEQTYRLRQLSEHNPSLYPLIFGKDTSFAMLTYTANPSR